MFWNATIVLHRHLEDEWFATDFRDGGNVVDSGSSSNQCVMSENPITENHLHLLFAHFSAVHHRKSVSIQRLGQVAPRLGGRRGCKVGDTNTPARQIEGRERNDDGGEFVEFRHPAHLFRADNASRVVVPELEVGSVDDQLEAVATGA